MPQLSLYIDKKTLETVERMAQISHKSISKWVCDQLKTSVSVNWPEKYFENFGILSGVEFPNITKLNFKDDVKRESI